MLTVVVDFFLVDISLPLAYTAVCLRRAAPPILVMKLLHLLAPV